MAISGIVKYFQPLLNDEYIAGLWRRRLISQLLWKVTDPTNSKRVLPYRAPSFSWASMDVEITPGSRQEVGISIEILDVSITSLTDDVTGQVSDGFLRLRGYLKEIDGHKSDNEWDILYGMIIFMDTMEDVSDMKTYRLLMCSSPGFYSRGLILRPVSKPGLRGCYERIGMFMRPISDAVELFRKPQANKAQFPCESYDENSGKHEFIIV